MGVSGKQLADAIALVIGSIERHGGVAPTDQLQRTYSEALIEYLVQESKLTRTVLNVKDANHMRPTHRINAVYTSTWTRERPAWLDDYLMKRYTPA